jgi:hypothetical protein
MCCQMESVKTIILINALEKSRKGNIKVIAYFAQGIQTDIYFPRFKACNVDIGFAIKFFLAYLILPSEALYLQRHLFFESYLGSI